jgi:hypothetical protein
VLTKFQVGHIPNVNVCYTTESDELEHGMDTYLYRQLGTNGSVTVDLKKELFKINELDDYKVDPTDTTD